MILPNLIAIVWKLSDGKAMELKYQFNLAHPRSTQWNRVVNWSEKIVKNFYDLPISEQPARSTPFQRLQSRAGPNRVNSFMGVRTNAILENSSIDSNSLSKFSRPDVANSLSGVVLDVPL
jgi:hypothetical protein